MKLLLLLVVLIGATLAENACPSQCKCSMMSSGSMMARCSVLNVGGQNFPLSVQNLEVSNSSPHDESINQIDGRTFADLGLSHIESIKIANTSLTTIDINAFRGLPNLYDLELSDNKIQTLDPDTFAFSTSLHRLVLAGNPLKPDLKKYFLRSETLTELDLSRCNLTTISPEMFSKLENLIFLSLGSNNLKDVGHFWEYKVFEFIEELDLSNNEIETIDKTIFSEHAELASLNLRKNHLKSFEAVEIPELEELDISQNRFQEINANTFKNIPEVIHVNLSYNQIHLIAEDSFIHVPLLKHLDLSHNKIKGPLPVYMLQKNKDIENLKLSGNRHMKVFTGVEGLSGDHKSMYTLDISDCGLEEIKSHSFQRMENIASLDLSGNDLHFLDYDVFSKLRHLNILNLSNNNLLALNTTIFSSNPDLRRLNLAGNNLMHLDPNLFKHIHHLRYLDVSNCQLTELWSFRDAAFMTTHKVLSNLEFLNLSNNSLKHLHINEFASTNALTTLDIKNNPLQCTKAFYELIQWFVKHEIDPERQRNEISQDFLDFDNTDEVTEKRIEWKAVIEQVCPPSKKLVQAVNKFQRVIGSDVKKVVENAKKDSKKEEEAELPEDNTLTVYLPNVDIDDLTHEAEKVEVLNETNLYNWMFWTFLVFGVVLLLAIINLTGVLCFQATPARSYRGPVGGYIRTNNDGGSLYYKLYEDCSVPNTPIVKNKTVVLDFNQFLKKPNNYNVVKDIDSLPSRV